MVLPVWLLAAISVGADPASFTQSGPVAQSRCPQCHAWRKPVAKRRVLTKPHNTLAAAHGASALWCLDCHLAKNPERLRLVADQSVSFAQTYRVCGICHVNAVRSWQAGIHGKRLHNWRGPRVIARCRVCHDPHQPAWPVTQPAPPPQPPGVPKK